MTKEQIWKWHVELQARVRQFERLVAAVAELETAMELYERLKDVAKAQEVRRSLEQTRPALAAAQEQLEDKAGVPLERAIGLAQAMDVRLGGLREADEQLAKMEAEFELAVTCQEFTDAKERQQAEEFIGRMRERRQTQLTLTEALVPNKPTLVLA